MKKLFAFLTLCGLAAFLAAGCDQADKGSSAPAGKPAAAPPGAPGGVNAPPGDQSASDAEKEKGVKAVGNAAATDENKSDENKNDDENKEE